VVPNAACQPGVARARAVLMGTNVGEESSSEAMFGGLGGRRGTAAPSESRTDLTAYRNVTLGVREAMSPSCRVVATRRRHQRDTRESGRNGAWERRKKRSSGVRSHVEGPNVDLPSPLPRHALARSPINI
jgi:hypothetical protein